MIMGGERYCIEFVHPDAASFLMFIWYENITMEWSNIREKINVRECINGRVMESNANSN
jgi:hypothetical protein